MEVNVDKRKLASNIAQKVGAVEGLPGWANISGVVLDRGLVVIQEGRVSVNLINVHNHSIVLYKGKTLGEWQPLKSVVKIVPSEDKYKQCRDYTTRQAAHYWCCTWTCQVWHGSLDSTWSFGWAVTSSVWHDAGLSKWFHGPWGHVGWNGRHWAWHEYAK